MRISKAEVARREAYVLSMFSKPPSEGGWGPDISIPKAAFYLLNAFGYAMNRGKLYELRERVRHTNKQQPSTSL